MVQDTKKKTTAAKSATKKKTDSSAAATKKISRSKVSRKKSNLLKLATEMNKLVADAVDREIIKRFRTIIDTNEEDITKVNLTSLFSDPKSADPATYDERIQPYVKHYLYMLKRKEKLEKEEKKKEKAKK